MGIDTDNPMKNDNTMVDVDVMNGGHIFIEPYNYCDYWCERCNVQEQCQVFNNQELEVEAGDNEVFNIYCQYLENNLTGFPGMPDDDEDADDAYDDDDEYDEYDEDDEYDDDEEYDEYDEDDEYDDDDEYNDDDEYDEDDDEYDDDDEEDEDIYAKIYRVEAHPLMEMCLCYQEKSEEFMMHYRERYFTPPLLREAFTNLEWYHTLLPLKMERILFSLYKFGAREEELALQDALLTSLVVYKSLRFSLYSVRELRENLVDYQEILMEMENLLVTIKAGLGHEFPFWILLGILCNKVHSPTLLPSINK